MLKLVLIRGLPGSGKSTFAKDLIDHYSLGTFDDYPTIFEADDYVEGDEFTTYKYDENFTYSYHAQCLADTYHKLANKASVIVANTFITYAEMIPYFEAAKTCHARVSVIVCRGNYGNVHNVPEAVLQKMKERWEE